MRYPLLFIILSFFPSSGNAAGSEIAGPVEAEVLRVIDGDTLLVEARPWPQQKVEVYVRIRGIDTPELRSSCPSERQAGEAARLALESLTEHAASLQLSRISGDKYFGRVVADVTVPGGGNVADYLLLAGLAEGYDGGRKAVRPCAVP